MIPGFLSLRRFHGYSLGPSSLFGDPQVTRRSQHCRVGRAPPLEIWEGILGVRWIAWQSQWDGGSPSETVAVPTP